MKRFLASFLAALLLACAVGCYGPSGEAIKFAKEFNRQTVKVLILKAEAEKAAILFENSKRNPGVHMGAYDHMKQLNFDVVHESQALELMSKKPVFKEASKEGLLKLDEYEKMNLQELRKAYADLCKK